MKALHHVGITVKDLDASIRFYHDVLGLEFSNEPSPWFDGEELGQAVGVPGAALRQVSLLLGDTMFELLEYKSPPSETTGPLESNSLGASHVAFLVDDIEAKKAELEAKGHRVLQRRQRRRRGRARRMAVGVLRGSGRLPARARRGGVLQRGRAARGNRRVSRVAIVTGRDGLSGDVVEGGDRRPRRRSCAGELIGRVEAFSVAAAKVTVPCRRDPAPPRGGWVRSDGPGSTALTHFCEEVVMALEDEAKGRPRSSRARSRVTGRARPRASSTRLSARPRTSPRTFATRQGTSRARARRSPSTARLVGSEAVAMLRVWQGVIGAASVGAIAALV